MRKKPESRTCCGCRMVIGKGEMFRIVKTPEGNILYDPAACLNGRGAYVCKNKDCLAKARKSKGLDRSLKIQVPESLYEVLEGAIKNA